MGERVDRFVVPSSLIVETLFTSYYVWFSVLPVERSFLPWPFFIVETWISMLPVNLGFGSFALPLIEISFSLATVRSACGAHLVRDEWQNSHCEVGGKRNA